MLIEQYKNKLNVYTADGIAGPCLFLTDYSSEEEKEAALYNFLEDILSLEVEKIAGISDCEIDITESNSGLPEADVRITVDNSFDDALETDIRANVAQALDISAENVKISYK